MWSPLTPRGGRGFIGIQQQELGLLCYSLSKGLGRLVRLMRVGVSVPHLAGAGGDEATEFSVMCGWSGALIVPKFPA